MGEVSQKSMADALRALAMDAVERAQSGHPGMPMGMADAAAALFSRHLKFCAAAPDWPDRDRFVLSAGHGSMLLYAILHLTGDPHFSVAQIKSFRQLGSRCAGHPEYEPGGAIETTTGPLGQGLANAVGMALAERMLAARFGDDLVDHRVFAVVGDGCLMEGISHEAASLAGHLRLSKLVVLFDDNKISIDGPTSLAVGDDARRRFESYGWNVDSCDGHDSAAVDRALENAKRADKPTLICCRTIIGFGAPAKGGTAAAHGAPLGAEEIAAARARLDWNHPPFFIPPEIQSAWEAIGRRGEAAKSEWEKRLARHPQKDEFLRRLRGDLRPDFDLDLRSWRRDLLRAPVKAATRKAGGEALAKLLPRAPELFGGSADLTGSNNTDAGQGKIARGDFGGGYAHYGVREHAMAAAMNGVALHGGFAPYGGTFLAFSDYCRPALRLAALMRIRAVFVMTHDSIGLGEDGPTHQPVEHLAALRAIPNLLVMRPGDAFETACCWSLALQSRAAPTILALSRQGLPPLPRESEDEEAEAQNAARGGYLVFGSDDDPEVTLAASGSEVGLIVSAAAVLREAGIKTAVVSMPCMELFDSQNAEYRARVIAPATPLLAVEAAIAMPWHKHRPAQAAIDFVCLDSFGVSAPAENAFRHFGFTVDNVVEKARNMVAAANLKTRKN